MRTFWLLVAAVIGGVLVWQGRPQLKAPTGLAVRVVRFFRRQADLRRYWTYTLVELHLNYALA